MYAPNCTGMIKFLLNNDFNVSQIVVCRSISSFFGLLRPLTPVSATLTFLKQSFDSILEKILLQTRPTEDLDRSFRKFVKKKVKKMTKSLPIAEIQVRKSGNIF